MNRKEMLLAQKAIAARQVKNDSKILSRIAETRSKEAARSKSRQASRSNHANQNGTLSLETFGESGGYLASPRSLPNIHSGSYMSSDFSKTSPIFSPASSLSNRHLEMVDELSQRSVTSRTGARKMQDKVAKAVKQRTIRRSIRTADSISRQQSRQRYAFDNSADDASLDGSIDASYVGSVASSVAYESAGDGFDLDDDNDDFFMPKVKLLRPDGASLSDVYRSKREDTWGKIIRANYREEVEMNKQKRKQKEKDDEMFGTLLKDQIAYNNRMKEQEVQSNNIFAKLEDATAKRTEDLQKQRTQDAINRHKQFIANAVEDMETKRLQREKELRKDLEDSTRMINKAKKLIQEDLQKKKDSTEYLRKYQEKLYQENLENIARKQRMKLQGFEEDKRIYRENEERFQRQQREREEDLRRKMQRSTEGPAHHIVQKIAEVKHQREEEFSQRMLRADNGLNKQLLTSELSAKQRAESNAQGLTDEWVRNRRIKEAKRKEDDERNQKILETMRQMLLTQEQEDIQTKQKKHEEHLRYQRDLDDQLNTLKQRSLKALQKTMTDEEMKYNKSLIRKTEIYGT